MISIDPIRAILWAQWRSLRNFAPRREVAGVALGSILAILTYGVVTIFAVIAARVLARSDLEALEEILSAGLFFLFLYWQIAPLLMAVTGLSLDTKKLLAYPIPKGALFGIEVLLRVSVALEVAILLTGVATGLLLNPQVKWWAPFWLLAFAVFNLFLSVGVRDLLTRLFARKRVREVAVFLMVMLAVLPQFVISHFLSNGSAPGWLRTPFHATAQFDWPWTSTARMTAGAGHLTDAAMAFVWIAAAYIFGRRQFDKGLRGEVTESATRKGAPNPRGRFEGLYRLPGALFRDPVAAILEKELRTLSRSARFRLVFLMGFSFGIVIWVPMATRHGGNTFMAEHFLTVASVYAVLLLSDTLFWNSFGFDRSAAQIYFVAPSGLHAALRGKNLAAISFLLLEITLVILACALLRMPITAVALLECYSVGLILALLLLTIGNYTSLLQPRPMNPASSFRSSTGGSKVQLTLLVAFPLACVPLSFAYLARFAFDSQAAFFGVLAVDGAIGVLAYRIGMESSVARAEHDTERLVAALSRGSGPVVN